MFAALTIMAVGRTVAPLRRTVRDSERTAKGK